jgi:hypothetical protein
MVELTPKTVQQLIDRETAGLERVVSYVTAGMEAARISRPNGERMILMAERLYDESVRLLRELLANGEPERREP